MNKLFPKDILPMLATLVDEPIDQEGWIYEVKWDGFRALGYVSSEVIELRSRNNKSFNEKFYPIYNALKDLKKEVVLDGEIIVLNKDGFPDFAALQTWRSEADGELVYYVFDLLWHQGEELMNKPLVERREMLKKALPAKGPLRMSETFNVSGKEFFAVAEKMGLEGIIAKNGQSFYTPEVRSKEWLKIKTVKHQEAIIGGFTLNENTSKRFSALLLGLFDGKDFNFIGPVGTGFTNALQKELIEKLTPLEIQQCPFREVPEYNKPSRFRPNPPKAKVVWVKPEIVVEISYRTVAPDGSLRHPSFKTIREDKKANEVRREKAVALHDKSFESNLIKNKIITEHRTKDRQTLLNPTNESQVRKIDGYDLKFSNLGKVFWPEQGITKRDMLNYYYQVAPIMLPFLKNRPQTLNRFPNGIQDESFYQKDVKGKVPSWVSTFKYYSEADKREKHFPVVDNDASLLYIVSLGCIEINPWSSRCENPHNPDWCIIDLDPDGNPFTEVIEAAQVTKQFLDSINIASYCKTSGSTGLHIYIPLEGKYDYEASKEFGRTLVKLVHRELPLYTSIERIKANRKGKLYLDFLQNRPQATVAAPYSLRPKLGATVSMPLYWDEVKEGLTIQQYHIKNAVSIIRERESVFVPVLGEGINLEVAHQKLKEFF